MSEKFTPIDDELPCEPYEVAVSDPALTDAEIAGFVIEEAVKEHPLTGESIRVPQDFYDPLESSKTLAENPQLEKKYRKAIENTGKVFELASEAEHAQGVFSCATCAIKGTCKALAFFKEINQKADTDFAELGRIREEIGELDRISDLGSTFSAWSKAQRKKDKAEDHGENRRDIAKMVDGQTEIRDKFRDGLLAYPTSEERDRAVQDIYKKLKDPSLRSDFARQGFIDGVVAEIAIYEALLEIQTAGQLKEVKFTNSEEDSRGGYDIEIVTLRGRKIRLDVKNSPTPSTKSIDAPHEFIREKVDYKDRQYRIYEISPTSPGNNGISTLKKRKLQPDGAEIASFEPTNKPYRLSVVVAASLKSVIEYERGFRR